MQKIRISELPLCSDLTGLYTIGVDKANESVKVSLEFLKESAASATEAAEAANTAAENADAATTKANTATADAEEATANAQAATTEIQNLIPTGFSVEYPSKITYGNQETKKIVPTFEPETALENVVYLSNLKSMEVNPDGTILVTGLGTTRIHCVPTMNTALAKTILIEVANPGLRLVATKQLRFTMSGGLRLT